MRFVSLPALLAISLPAMANEPPSTPASMTMSAFEDGQATIVFSGADAENDPISYEITAQPSHGSITWRAGLAIYTPQANYNGADSFTYIGRDALSTSLPTTVTVTVAGTQDIVDPEPIAIDVDEDGSVQFSLSAMAEAGVNVGWELIEGPSGGTLHGEGQMWGRSAPTLVYEPDADFFGADRIVVAAYDKGSPAPAILEIPIEVAGSADAPSSFALTAPEAGAQVTTIRPVLQWSTATDADGDEVSYAIRVFDADTGIVVDAESGITSLRPVAEYRLRADLQQGHSYTWEVTASDGFGGESYATGGWFDVSSNNAPPTGLGIVSPEYGAQLTTDAPSIVFEPAYDPEGGAVWHDIEVDTARDFSGDDRFQARVPGGGGLVAVNLEDFDYALPRYARAYARVRAVDAAGAYSSWETIQFVSGGPNGAPEQPSIAIISEQMDSDCMWSFSSEDPNGDDVQFEVTKTLEGSVSSYTSFYAADDPGAAYLCPRTADGALQGVWVRAIDEHGAMSDWAFADADEVASAGSSCSMVPGTLGFLPIGLALIGLRRRRD